MGAIIGDIVGSVYEFNNIKTKDFPLFRKDCFFTDDTVMTIAVAEAIMSGGSEEDFAREMKRYGRMYPDRGYGGRFSLWLRRNDNKPYKSLGNGSAMRVSPCGWFDDETKVKELAKRSAIVTHNHPEGIKGAMATADAIYIARMHRDIKSVTDIKAMIKEHSEKEYGYDLSRTLDEIRPVYTFDETCMKTVPEAIIAFLESENFEDAIRNAISLGGDSDTLAAITGSIAEAAYGIPEEIKEKAYAYLDEPLKDVVGRWKRYIKENA